MAYLFVAKINALSCLPLPISLLPQRRQMIFAYACGSRVRWAPPVMLIWAVSLQRMVFINPPVSSLVVATRGLILRGVMGCFLG